MLFHDPKTIRRNNALIFEFLEGEKEQTLKKVWVYPLKNPSGNTEFYALKDLKFHSSWDWLMPVVDKIERLGYLFFISDLKIEYAHRKEYPSVSYNFFIPSSKLTATWVVVVYFISLYNQNKLPNQNLNEL